MAIKSWKKKADQIARIQRMSMDIHKQIELHCPDGKIARQFRKIDLKDGMWAQYYDDLKDEDGNEKGFARIFNSDGSEWGELDSEHFLELLERMQ